MHMTKTKPQPSPKQAPTQTKVQQMLKGCNAIRASLELIRERVERVYGCRLEVGFRPSEYNEGMFFLASPLTKLGLPWWGQVLTFGQWQAGCKPLVAVRNCLCPPLDPSTCSIEAKVYDQAIKHIVVDELSRCATALGLAGLRMED